MFNGYHRRLLPWNIAGTKSMSYAVKSAIKGLVNGQVTVEQRKLFSKRSRITIRVRENARLSDSRISLVTRKTGVYP